MSSDRQSVESEVRVEHPAPHVSVIRLIGEHDLATKGEISEALDVAFESADGTIVDLTEADFIDSSTLHVLVSAARRATESGRSLSLVIGENDVVRQLFDLTGLLTQFETAASVDEAVGALRTGSNERP